MFTLAWVHPPDSRDRAMQEQDYLTFLIGEAYFTCDAQMAIHRKLGAGDRHFAGPVRRQRPIRAR
jgi:hypothetical protein